MKYANICLFFLAAFAINACTGSKSSQPGDKNTAVPAGMQKGAYLSERLGDDRDFYQLVVSYNGSQVSARLIHSVVQVIDYRLTSHAEEIAVAPGYTIALDTVASYESEPVKATVISLVKIYSGLSMCRFSRSL